MTNTKTKLPTPAINLSLADTVNEFGIAIKHAQHFDRACTKAFATLVKCAFSQDSEEKMNNVLTEGLNIVHNEAKTNWACRQLRTRMVQIYKTEFMLTVELIRKEGESFYKVSRNEETVSYKQVRDCVSTRNGHCFDVWKKTDTEKSNAKANSEAKKAEKAAKAETEKHESFAKAMAADYGDDNAVAKELQSLWMTIQANSKSDAQSLEALKALHGYVKQYFEQSK